MEVKKRFDKKYRRSGKKAGKKFAGIKKRYYLCKRKRGGESKLLIGSKLAEKNNKKDLESVKKRFTFAPAMGQIPGRRTAIVIMAWVTKKPLRKEAEHQSVP